MPADKYEEHFNVPTTEWAISATLTNGDRLAVGRDFTDSPLIAVWYPSKMPGYVVLLARDKSVAEICSAAYKAVDQRMPRKTQAALRNMLRRYRELNPNSIQHVSYRYAADAGVVFAPEAELSVVAR